VETPELRILCCVKRVPITGGRIVLTPDGQAIETKHLGFTYSPHEECGVEEAVRIIEANGGESVVLTLGPPEAVEQLRDAMALGIDRAIHLQTDGAGRAQGDPPQEWDAQATAEAITDAIRTEEAASGPFDLIFFGNESADSGGFQVGIRVAHALGRRCVTGLKGVKLEGASVRCEQDADGGRDVYMLPLPAVLTVKEGLNLPRYPSVPGRMRAMRKPVAMSTPTRPDSRLEMTRLAVPGGSGRKTERLGSGPSAAPAVVEMLRKIGVV
jgi:electron transfer flavoprotein beta subunit